MHFFVLKMGETLSGQIWTLRKWDVFSVKNEFVPSCLIFLLFDMYFYKNKIHHTMQREKLYKLQRTIMERLDKKERIRLLPKNSSHFPNVQIWPLGVSPIFKTKKCIYKISGRL